MVQKRTQPSPPKPLPRKRRALSTTSSRRTLPSRSQLLNRLPLEIRFEIYRYVLGDNLLHLVQGKKQISHVRCRAASVPDYARSCRPSAASTAARLFPGSTSNGNLALLQTCRQVYQEAIDLLYSTNVFDLDDPRTLFYLSRSIRPQRLASITKLHVYFPLAYQCWCASKDDFPTKAPPYDEATWKRFWHIIATQMPRLAELRLCFGAGYGCAPAKVTQAWVKPLLQIRGLRRFACDAIIDNHELDTAMPQLAEVTQYLRENICIQP